METEAKTLTSTVPTRKEEIKPGIRLEQCVSFVARAEKRLQTACDAVTAAEKALVDARASQEQLAKELRIEKRMHSYSTTHRRNRWRDI